MARISRENWHEHPEARLELLEAGADFLNLGGSRGYLKFLAAVEAAFIHIEDRPGSWQIYEDVPATPPIHQIGVGQYSYKIFYQVKNHQVYILAFANTYRKPGYWGVRLKDFGTAGLSVSHSRLAKLIGVSAEFILHQIKLGVLKGTLDGNQYRVSANEASAFITQYRADLTETLGSHF